MKLLRENPLSTWMAKKACILVSAYLVNQPVTRVNGSMKSRPTIRSTWIEFVLAGA
jgi:hypothetical protein